MVLYGPYLCVNSFEIKNASFKVKLKKITIEKLSNFKWGENIELNTMAQLETLNGTVTLKIPYESMQIRLLPFITFKSETHSRSNIDSFLLRLDANQNYEFKKRLTETQLKIFASDFCKHQNIKQGFWDESCKSYFLLFGQNNFTYELNPYGLFLLGSICLDLEIGFFGFCETSLHKKWNHLFFEPWIKQKDPNYSFSGNAFFAIADFDENFKERNRHMTFNHDHEQQILKLPHIQKKYIGNLKKNPSISFSFIFAFIFCLLDAIKRKSGD